MIYKITVGFVMQVFDVEKGEFISQDFTCGDQVDYEDENGDPVDPGLFSDSAGRKVYLPFEMYQPGQPEVIQSFGDSPLDKKADAEERD